MSRMIRKQVYVEPRQEEILKRRSTELGISEAELIRRAIEQVAWGPVSGQVDRGAWESAKAFTQQHRRLEALQTGRAWTREQLYDERFERFSH